MSLDEHDLVKLTRATHKRQAVVKTTTSATDAYPIWAFRLRKVEARMTKSDTGLTISAFSCPEVHVDKSIRHFPAQLQDSTSYSYKLYEVDSTLLLPSAC